MSQIIIDASNGIDSASPQVSQYTDNFDSIKFVLDENLSDYTVMIVTNINGKVEIIESDGVSLVKTTDSSTGNTVLVWTLSREVTASSGVVLYQISAYKQNDGNTVSVWYSREGRLIVSDSISTNEYSEALIGSYPNLVTQLILMTEETQKNVAAIESGKVDKVSGMGLSECSYTTAEKQKLEDIEAHARQNVIESIYVDGLLLKADNKSVSIDLSGKVDHDELARELSYKADNSRVTSVAELADEMSKKLSTVASGAEVNVQSDWNETDTGSDAFIKNKPTVDWEYNSESTNAQSGKAVAQGLAELNEKLLNIPVTVLEEPIHDISELDGYTDGIYYFYDGTVAVFGGVPYSWLIATKGFQYFIDFGGNHFSYRSRDEVGNWHEVIKTNDNLTVDQSYDSTSTNAQSGKAVNMALSLLSNVAQSGDYNDLLNVPVEKIELHSMLNIGEDFISSCVELDNAISPKIYYLCYHDDLNATPNEYYCIVSRFGLGIKELSQILFTNCGIFERFGSTEEDGITTYWGEWTKFATNIDIPKVDLSYNPESENAQSGIAVAEALKNISGTSNITVDQSYNSESENPQSGQAVAEATRNIIPTISFDEMDNIYDGGYYRVIEDTGTEIDKECLLLVTYHAGNTSQILFDNSGARNVRTSVSYGGRWGEWANEWETLYTVFATKEDLASAIGEALEGEY